MARKTLERRKLAEQRWPHLANVMACHFNQDFDVIYGSLAEAITAISLSGTLEYRQAVLMEWKDWNTKEGVVDDIRPALEAGFAIDIGFGTPIAARHFMNRIHDELVAGIRAELGREGLSRQ